MDRAGPAILQRDLPLKTEYVLQLGPSRAQLALYAQALEALAAGVGGPRSSLRDKEVCDYGGGGS